MSTWLTRGLVAVAATILTAQAAVPAHAATTAESGTSDPTGVVVGWGYAANQRLDVPVAAQAGAQAVVMTVDSSAALVDGGVVVWGSETSPTAALLAVPEEARSGVTAIAAGSRHLLALKDGGVIAWGVDGDWGITTVPDEARSGVTAIAACGEYSLALKGGRVIGWGHNSNGQLDIPDEALTGVDAIAAGYGHALALKAGRVIAWGQDNTYHSTTVPAEALSGVDQIAAGASRSMALKGGALIAWGQGLNDGVPAEVRTGVGALEPHANLVVIKDGAALAWTKATDATTTTGPEATQGISAVAFGEGGTYLAVRSYPLGIPRQVVATSGPDSAAVSWVATVPRWGAVSGYRVESAPLGAETWTVRIPDTGSADPRATITGLPTGTPVRFRVTALEGSRPSPTSEPSEPVVLGDSTALRSLPVSVSTTDGVPVTNAQWVATDLNSRKLDQGTADSQGRFTTRAFLTAPTLISFIKGKSGLAGTITVPAWQARVDIRTGPSFQVQIDVVDGLGAPLCCQWGELNDATWLRTAVASHPTLTVSGPVGSRQVGPSGADGRLTVAFAADPGDVGLLTLSNPLAAPLAVGVSDLERVAPNRLAGKVSYAQAPILEDAGLAGPLPGGPATSVRSALTPTMIVRTPAGAPVSARVWVYRDPVPADIRSASPITIGSTDPATGRVSFPDLDPGQYWAVIGETPSRVVHFAVPTRAPSAPDGPTATLTSDGVRIQWAAPGRTGGSPITSYVVTEVPGGRTWRTTGTELTVSGLTPGQEYAFTVQAANAAGVGTASWVSNSVVYWAPVTIRVKAVKHRGVLTIDVDPDLGKGSWTVVVQQRRSDGSWFGRKQLRTRGASETNTVDLPKGTYRVRFHATRQYLGTTSASVRLVR